MIEPPCLAWRARCARGLSLLLQTPLPPGSHRCPINSRFAEGQGALTDAGLEAVRSTRLDRGAPRGLLPTWRRGRVGARRASPDTTPWRRRAAARATPA